MVHFPIRILYCFLTLRSDPAAWSRCSLLAQLQLQFSSLVFVLVTGCTKGPLAPSAEDVPTEIDDDLSGLDELDTDLDLSELESLDQEFADLEAMFS